MSSQDVDERLYRLVGERVRARRGSLTQSQLAERVGLGRTSITNLESGSQRMPLHYLARVADALGCDLRDLLPGKEELTGGSARVVGGATGSPTPLTDALIAAHFGQEAGEP